MFIGNTRPPAGLNFRTLTMDGSYRRIHRVDRIALAAIFAAATLIVVSFGFAARAAPQTIPLTASGAMFLVSNEAVASPCHGGRH
jgi:hypothetical protein